MNFGQIQRSSGNTFGLEDTLISGYLYLLSAAVITVIRSRYVNVSTLSEALMVKIQGAYCKME